LRVTLLLGIVSHTITSCDTLSVLLGIVFECHTRSLLFILSRSLRGFILYFFCHGGQGGRVWE
jgi:hypothetical protein